MTKTSSGILMGLALCAAALNLRPAINSISPLLDSLRHELCMSASTASLLTTFPVLCMGLFSPLAAKLGGRYGIERVLGWALALIGIGTALRWLTHSVLLLLATAFLAGVGIAAASPLLSGFIKRYFPGQTPLMISVYSVALSFGAAIASGLTAPLQAQTHSWQFALGAWAILAVIAVPVWWLVVLRKHSQPTAAIASRDVSVFPWKNRTAWLLTLSFGLMAMMFYSITAWLPPIIEDMGYSKLQAGNVLTVFAFIQIPVVLLLPVIMKRYPSRLFLLLAFSFAELIGFALLIFTDLIWLAAAFIGIGAGAIFPLNLLLPIDATQTPQDAANWSSMIQSAGYVIGAAGPLLLGWAHDVSGSFAAAIVGLMLINIAMMAIQAAVVPMIQRNKARIRS